MPRSSRVVSSLLALALLPLSACATEPYHHDPWEEPAPYPHPYPHAAPHFVPAGPYIGVDLLPMGPELRAYFRVPEDRGVLVAGVEPASPAAEAGIQPGDVILEAAGEPIADPSDLARLVQGAPEGARLQLRLTREGKPLQLEVTPRLRPAPAIREGGPGHGPGPMMGGPPLDELREEIRTLERRIDQLERRLGPEPGTPDEPRT
jgi:membrane-associated protease RseP (regulator of RpoE activity)